MIKDQGGYNMSKKLICLLLGVVMLLGVLASCSGDKAGDTLNKIEDEASENAVTLAMYLLSEEPVSSDTEAEIESALNAITEKRFKTRIDLRYYTLEGYYYYTDKEYTEKAKEVKLYIDAEGNVNNQKIGDQIIDTTGDLKSEKFPELKAVHVAGYYQQIDKAFADRAEAKANGTIKQDKSEKEQAQETETVNGQVRIKYPTIADYQVDILYMGGEEIFQKYRADGMLSKIEDDTLKDLKTNIPNQYLANIKQLNGNGTYAIPTSKAIGDYTYLLLNKQALEDAYRSVGNGVSDPELYSSLTSKDVKDFIEYTLRDSEKGSEFYGIYTNLSKDELLINNIRYWGVDSEGSLSNAFSVLGGYYSNSDKYLSASTYVGIENLFENDDFVDELKTLKYYESENYINYEKQEGKKFAVGYVTGGAELYDEYGAEYELVPVAIPRLTEEELYSDLYGVCSYTSNMGRSMQIINQLNMDENIRNLILYGVKDKHYRLIDTTLKNEYGENVMAVLRTDVGKAYYNMDINKTGNTFVAYHELTDEEYSAVLALSNEDKSDDAASKALLERFIRLKDYHVKQNQEAQVDLELGYKINYGLKVNCAAEGSEGYETSLMNVKALSEKLYAEYKDCSYENIDEFIAKAQKETSESAAVQHHIGCALDVEHEADGTVKDDKEKVCDSLYCSHIAWLKDKKIIK